MIFGAAAKKKGLPFGEPRVIWGADARNGQKGDYCPASGFGPVEVDVESRTKEVA
jgi:hypothetical protein